MDKEEFLLSHIAKMYYIDGMKQNEIAKNLDLTPMAVSRALRKANQTNIVTIHIKSTWDMDMELGRAVREKYGLKECTVLNPSEYMDPQTLIARYLVDYFSLFAKDNMVIACSWGKTIAEFATSLPFLNVHDCSVVQMNGAVWSPNPNVMPTQILQNLSRKLNARSYPMNAPLYVDSATTKENLLRDPMNTIVEEMTEAADVAIIGASGFEKTSTTVASNRLVAEAWDELAAHGAIGDLAGVFLDKKGEPINWSRSALFMGVPLNRIAKAKNVICLAGGKSKAPVLKAAAKKRYYTTLVTTKETALAMLGEE